MTHKSLRFAVGLSSVSALALALVGCGGSNSSNPVTPTNQAPTNVRIAGPTNVVAQHSWLYNLSATDPEGDPITFSTTVAGATVNGTTMTYIPAALTAPTTANLVVKATDSKGASADSPAFAVQVIPNRAPVFNGQNAFSWTNPSSGSAPASYAYAPTATDPDGDDVAFTLVAGSVKQALDTTTTPGTFSTVADSTVTATGSGTTAASFAVSSAVPTGFFAKRIQFAVRGNDRLPGSTANIGAQTDFTVTLTVYTGNLPPAITTNSIPTVAVNHGIPNNVILAPGFQFTASDPNPGDTKAWSLVSTEPANSGIALTADGILTWTTNKPTATGFQNVTVKVTDGGGLFDQKTYQINIVPDSKPNFVNDGVYTETVGGVQFFDPANVRQTLTSVARFNLIDTWRATDSEFFYDEARGLKGWRANIVANDVEGDSIDFTLKTNSVFRFGQYVTNPAYAGYPAVVNVINPATGVNSQGELRWTPNRHRYWDLSVSYYGDSLGYPDDAQFPVPTVFEPANWSFTIVATEMIDGVRFEDQKNETTLKIKVQPNEVPIIGPLNVIQNATLSYGVYVGGGARLTPTIVPGRPSIQEPVASDTGDPGTPSTWIWLLGVNGNAGVWLPADGVSSSVEPATLDPLVGLGGFWPAGDFIILDPDSNDIDGHRDAIQVDFGKRTTGTVKNSTRVVTGPLQTPATTYPSVDTTGNYPTVDTANSTQFWNPWIHTQAARTFVVNWAPIRIQYTLGRYLGQQSYGFSVTAEDQYATARSVTKNIFPLFGTVRIFDSRFILRTDAGTDPLTSTLRGFLYTTGNTYTSTSAYAFPENYIFSYQPQGVSSAAGNPEFVDVATTVTYGSDLFGRSDGLGGPASGYGDGTGLYVAPGAGLYTAGAWHTLDGLNAGHLGYIAPNPGAYSPQPLNTLLNPAPRAAGVPGTTSPAAQSYTQLTGAAPSGLTTPVTLLTVNVAGRYSNNEALARVVPSNSPYLFTQPYQIRPYDNNGLTAVRQLNVPDMFRQWYFGKVQSEVQHHIQIAGRPVYYSDAPSFTWGTFRPMILPIAAGDPDLGLNATSRARLRMSFSWPTYQTLTVAGYSQAGDPNLFGLWDVIQVATPNQSGNGRFFFTGNYTNFNASAVDERDVSNWFGNYGITFDANLVDPVNNGITHGIGTTAHPHQAIHEVTQSIWVPNAADGHYNFPNVLTSPSGGSGYTDIPFTGLKGTLRNEDTSVPASAFAGELNLKTVVGGPLNLNGRVDSFHKLSVADNPYNMTLTGQILDRNANPALVNTASDRVFWLWMKKEPDATVMNAYGCYSGSMLTAGDLAAFGGRTTAPAFNMANGSGPAGLTDTQAQISFAKLGEQLGANQQDISGTTSITIWRKRQFEGLAALMAAPAQWGLAPRARLVDPSVNAGASDNTLGTFDNAAANTYDGFVNNSLVVYGVRTRAQYSGNTSTGWLGEAGIEPNSPILAQWWNTGNGADAQVSTDFPQVIRTFCTEWLPSEFTPVVQVNHNFIGKLVYPFGSPIPATAGIQKVLLQAGLIAPVGHSLLADLKPVVTPVRQLNINDLKINKATGSRVIGTRLDIFNASSENLATGLPSPNYQSLYRLTDGNATGNDYRLHGDSALQLTFQPMVNDLRNPSGYIVTLYVVQANDPANPAAGTEVFPIHEFRFGHLGGIGAIQTLNLPSMRSLWGAANGTSYAFAVKVRNVWMEGTEGPAGHSFDMGKNPYAQKFPMAYADCLSGVFVVRF